MAILSDYQVEKQCLMSLFMLVHIFIKVSVLRNSLKFHA